MERELRSNPAFSKVDCFLTTGNARKGWRELTCSSDVMVSGIKYDVTSTTTPISCSSVHTEVLFISPEYHFETQHYYRKLTRARGLKVNCG
jgi:hypothetical protein